MKSSSWRSCTRNGILHIGSRGSDEVISDAGLKRPSFQGEVGWDLSVLFGARRNTLKKLICRIALFGLLLVSAAAEADIVVKDDLRLQEGGALVFSDGSVQSTAQVQGPTGPQGPTGTTGAANSLTIGTVQTGSSAVATITGVAPRQVLNLTIPQGVQGPQGPTGLCSSPTKSLLRQKTWSNSTEIDNYSYYYNNSGILVREFGVMMSAFLGSSSYLTTYSVFDNQGNWTTKSTVSVGVANGTSDVSVRNINYNYNGTIDQTIERKNNGTEIVTTKYNYLLDGSYTRTYSNALGLYTENYNSKKELLKQLFVYATGSFSNTYTYVYDEYGLPVSAEEQTDTGTIRYIRYDYN